MRQRDDMTFPHEEYVRRIEGLRERMRERRLDAVVISDPENIMYLTDYQTTGYSFFQALVVPLDGDCFMVTRNMEESNVHARTWVEKTRPYADNGDAIQQLIEALREFGLSLGFTEVASGPLVRSSYRADRVLEGNNLGIYLATEATDTGKIPVKQL